jgi:NTE family protein
VTGNANKKIGLALGGGAALGAVHVGVLRYLEEKNFEITHIAGTSVGALVGGAYACGVPVVELTRFARRARWTKITRPAIPRMSLFTNDRLVEQVRRLIGEKNFHDTKIPFAAVAASLETGNQVVLRRGPLVDAIVASCAIPGIFEPVEWEGELLCDGGIVNQVPDDIVWEMGAGRVIAVDLIANVTGNERPSNIFGVIYKSLNILMKRTMFYHPETEVIFPATTGFSTADLSNYRALIRIGYRAAEKALGKI